MTTREQQFARRAVARLQPETRRKLAATPPPPPAEPGEDAYRVMATLIRFCTKAGVDPREVLEAMTEALNELE